MICACVLIHLAHALSQWTGFTRDGMVLSELLFHGAWVAWIQLARPALLVYSYNECFCVWGIFLVELDSFKSLEKYEDLKVMFKFQLICPHPRSE